MHTSRYVTRSVIAVAVFAVLQLTSIAASPGGGEPRIASSFEAEPGAAYPFRQNMYRALTLTDGRVIALSIARDAASRQQTLQGRYSADNGATWSEPSNLLQFPKEAGGFGLFEALVDHEGEIQFFVLGDGNSGILFPVEEGKTPTYDTLEIWHVRSSNKATAWGKPKCIRRGKNGDLLSATQMSNGRLVLPICFDTGRSVSKWGDGFLKYVYTGPYSCSSMHSDDNGETWHDSPDVLTVETPDLHTWGCDEPSAIQLKDGRAWMLMRTQKGRFYESFSDDGARWSAPRPSRLISSDAPAGLFRLPDGSLLLFSNACLRYPYGYGARYVLHAAISTDEGKKWRGYREVARDPHRNDPPDLRGDYGVSYTFPTLTADGKVLFSNWVEQGNIRRFRRFDPAWLLETQQKSDFSRNLDDWSIFGSKGVELQTDPDSADARVLSVRKADPEWPAGAVWNFPIGPKGRLKLQIKANSNFGGALLGLTDHFSPPWDLEDEFHNVFNVPVSPSTAELGANARLTPDHWYDLELSWDTNGGQCKMMLDGSDIATLEDNRRSDIATLEDNRRSDHGINYLRVRSTSIQPDGGLLIRSIEADVSESWGD